MRKKKTKKKLKRNLRRKKTLVRSHLQTKRYVKKFFNLKSQTFQSETDEKAVENDDQEKADENMEN